MTRIRGSLLLASLLSMAPQIFAQTGQITGQVSDRSGARVPGADIAVINMGTGVASPATTNTVGYYTVPFLAPGEYRITVTKNGFKTATPVAIKLDVHQIARIDFDLELGSQTEQVSVSSSAAPLLQSETSALGQVIGERTVSDLPLNGRNLTQLTTLT